MTPWVCGWAQRGVTRQGPLMCKGAESLHPQSETLLHSQFPLPADTPSTRPRVMSQVAEPLTLMWRHGLSFQHPALAWLKLWLLSALEE